LLCKSTPLAVLDDNDGGGANYHLTIIHPDDWCDEDDTAMEMQTNYNSTQRVSVYIYNDHGDATT